MAGEAKITLRGCRSMCQREPLFEARLAKVFERFGFISFASVLRISLSLS